MPTTTNDIEPLLPLSEACRILGIAERTARSWAQAGVLPVVRFSSRCLRVRASELRALIVSRSTPSRGR
jgi:predicted site-specific integrase-resolvase